MAEDNEFFTVPLAARLMSRPVGFGDVESFHDFVGDLFATDEWDTDPALLLLFSDQPKQGRVMAAVFTVEDAKPYTVTTHLARAMVSSAREDHLFAKRIVAASFYSEAWAYTVDKSVATEEEIQQDWERYRKVAARSESKVISTIEVDGDREFHSFLHRGVDTAFQDSPQPLEGGGMQIALAELRTTLRAMQ